MKLRRYCVTVLDNWTLTREFWTLEGAKNFYKQHRASGNVYRWEFGDWQWMFGSKERLQS